MPPGQPAVKLAIRVDPVVHAGVVRAAREERMSVSAWMTAAARRSLRIRDGLAAVAEWEAEHGAFTADELAAAPTDHAGRWSEALRTPSGRPPSLALGHCERESRAYVAADEGSNLNPTHFAGLEPRYEP
jgi:hypothetical protein